MQAKEQKHLPLFGAGPAYVITITIVTLACILLHHKGIIGYSTADLPGEILPDILYFTFRITGIILMIIGPVIWINAVVVCRLTDNVKENHLITEGVYAWVRHPIYAAFTLFEWGLILWTNDIVLLVLIPCYWVFFSLLMKNTEEKWLLEQYGQEYEDYAKRVNRCIPWFPKKKK